MAFRYGWRGPTIVSDGLILYLDAGSPNSYRTDFGTTWKDISGNGRNFALTSTTFSTDSGGAINFNGSTSKADGPASNAMGLVNDGEYTIEIIVKPQSAGQFAHTFKLYETGANSDATRGAFAHLPWISDEIYFDTGGCCDADQRIVYSDNVRNVISHFAFRKRNSTTPRRNIFKNGTSRVDSGANTNASITWSSTAVNLGYADSGWYSGLIYVFRIYNRPLSDIEILQNYNATKSRFGL